MIDTKLYKNEFESNIFNENIVVKFIGVDL